MTPQQHRADSRRISRETDWLAVFPEAKPVVEQLLRSRLEERKQLKTTYKTSLTEYLTKATIPEVKLAAEIVLGSYYGARLDANALDIKRLYFDLKKHQPQPKESTALTQESIDRAKNYPLTDLFEAEGFVIRRQGATHLTHCPLHDESTPSCTIYPDNHFFCYGCQKGGDTLDLVQKLKNLSFREAVAYLIN